MDGTGLHLRKNLNQQPTHEHNNYNKRSAPLVDMAADLPVSCVRCNIIHATPIWTMTHEKIFIREDGGRVKVAVTLTTFPMTDEYLWNHSVQFCPKGKRKLQYKHDAATAEEILQTKLELHEKIRPS